MRERFGPIELSWRRERADNAEEFAEFMSTLDTTALMMGGVNPDGSASETMRKIQSLGEGRSEIDQRAYRAVAAVIGAEKSEAVFRKTPTMVGGDDGGAPERAEALSLNPAALATEAEVEETATAGYSGSVASAAVLSSAPPAWSTGQLARLMKPLGVSDASLAILEGIVDDWNKREWEAKVVPLGRQLSELNLSLYDSMPAANIACTSPTEMSSRPIIGMACRKMMVPSSDQTSKWPSQRFSLIRLASFTACSRRETGA
jgi:hypothetical protein